MLADDDDGACPNAEAAKNADSANNACPVVKKLSPSYDKGMSTSSERVYFFPRQSNAVVSKSINPGHPDDGIEHIVNRRIAECWFTAR